ncbi:MAG: cation:proton antiporter [Planctomycetota bacterium]
MDPWTIVVDLTVLLSAAVVLGALCERLRQSAIVGYILAGMILGPNVLQVLASTEEVEFIAEIGVALLLFAIGLEFSWRRLRAMGLATFGGGAVQILATAGIFTGCAIAIGRPTNEAVVIGVILALSSTAGVLRVLQSRGELESVRGGHALGVLLVQDAAVIPCMLLVSVLVRGGAEESVALILGKLLLFVGIAALALYVVFAFIVPRLLSIGSVGANRELSVLTAIVSALGATLLAHTAGLSPGLGAFIAGILLGGSPFAAQVRADVSGLRILFVTVFFSSIGALGDPGWMLRNWAVILPVVGAIVICKSLIAWGALRLFGAGAVGALAAGISIAQIGEFSFIISEVARGKVLSEYMFLLLVSSTALTMLLTPYLVAAAPRMAGFLLRRRVSAASSEAANEPSASRVLVIGFGPAGRTVAERVRDGGGRVAILDLNMRGVEEARRLGFEAFHGDGQHEDILLHVGLRATRAVVVTVPDPAVAVDIVRLVRVIAPSAILVARSRYNRHYRDFVEAGAQVVHDEETRAGVQLSKPVLEAIQPAKDAGPAPADVEGEPNERE